MNGEETGDPGARLRRLAALPDAVWDEYQLRKDPLSGRIDADRRREIPKQAAAAARAAGERLQTAFGVLPPSAYAKRLDIAISHERPSSMGRAPFLSLALRTPPTIVVSPEALAVAETQLAISGATLSEAVDWREVAIGHELFHHLEWRESIMEKAVAEITTWRLGPLRLRGRPVAAEEIAAMYFSRMLAGCGMRPDFLEIPYLLGTNPEAAESWLSILESLAEKPEA